MTPSRFDDFINGNDNALSKAEKEGLEVFIDKGCASCHNGIALGGTMQPFQVAGKYKFAQVGDFVGDKNGMVKTPTLRNISETAPYFHNGAIWTLKDAIDLHLGGQQRHERRGQPRLLHEPPLHHGAGVHLPRGAPDAAPVGGHRAGGARHRDRSAPCR